MVSNSFSPFSNNHTCVKLREKKRIFLNLIFQFKKNPIVTYTGCTIYVCTAVQEQSHHVGPTPIYSPREVE